MRYANLASLVNELNELCNRLERGSAAWYSGAGDEYDMASCDPSDHYMLETQIEQKKKEIRNIVMEWEL